MKTRLNNAFQKAVQSTQPLKFLRENEAKLTSKQRQELLAAGRKLAKPAKVQPSQRASRAPILRTRVPSRQIDVRHPMYNELFAAAHAPRSWPTPRPFFSVDASGHKCVSVRACTGSNAHVLAPGEYLLAWLSPYDRTSPMWVSKTTSTGTVGQAVSNINLSPTSIKLDTVPTGTLEYGSYVDASPSTYFEDTAAIQSGNEFFDPSTSLHPVMTQLQAASMQFSIMTPYGGSATVSVVSPGDAPNFIGRHNETVRAGVASEYHENFDQHLKSPWTTGGSFTPVQIAASHGKVTLLPGNAQLHASWAVHGDTGWTWTGTQSTVAAPPAGTNLWNKGFQPRCFNAKVQYGYLLVQNTSSTDNLTVLSHAKLTLAYVVNPDDAQRSIGALASLVARDAPSLVKHNPERDIRGVVQPSTSGTPTTSHDAIRTLVSKATGSIAAAESAVADFASKHSTIVELAGAAGIASTGIFSGAASKLGAVARSLFAASPEASIVGGLGPRPLSSMMSNMGIAAEEVGASALAYAEAAAPYLAIAGAPFGV